MLVSLTIDRVHKQRTCTSNVGRCLYLCKISAMHKAILIHDYIFIIIIIIYFKQRNHSFVIIRDLKELPWLGVQRLSKNKVKDWVLTWEQQPQLNHGQHKKLFLIWIMLVSSTQGLSRLCILWHWVVLYLKN
jgi:hypothetical protein